MRHRVLLVEDEEDLAEPLSIALEREGYQVQVVGDGLSAVDLLARDDLPDLLLLDLMLPGLSGLEVCRRVRADPRTAWLPVILITARADEYDKVVGFEAGADDYVIKPFSLREVALRVRALLRRAREPASGETVWRSGGVVVDEVRHEVTLDGAPIELTAVEFRLLAVFVRHANRALTRDRLRQLAWGDDYAITERAVDTNVRRLRQRLGDAVGARIETLRGVGYRWTE